MPHQQLSLPLFQDRGQVNAFKNIIATVEHEFDLQQKNCVAEISKVIEFCTKQFREILERCQPFDLRAHETQTHLFQSVSPYPFQIHDLISNRNQRKVFPTLNELVSSLNLPRLSRRLRESEIIGIDESIVNVPLPQSNFTFLKSIAFRMYKNPDNTLDESLGPIVSHLRTQLGDSSEFENENKLIGYIHNIYIAYVSALSSLQYGRNPFIILHGPLIRAIGGFSHITFDYRIAKELLSIDVDNTGNFNPPREIEKVMMGDENLKKFHTFCIETCQRQCAQHMSKQWERDAIPQENSEANIKTIRNRKYPGFCLYFWVLRRLFDLNAQERGRMTVVSVVENISGATEMTSLILPSLLERLEQDSNSRKPFAEIPNSNRRSDFFRKVKEVREKYRLADATLFTFALDEGQYTAPVQIYRYTTRDTYIHVLNDNSLGIRNKLGYILNKLFPIGHYKVLMSYLRTTPFREPVRVEFFQIGEGNDYYEEVIGAIYLLSLSYQQYGLPIILYYADKLAHTPNKLIEILIERSYLDILQRKQIDDPVQIMQLLGKLSRNYFER